MSPGVCHMSDTTRAKRPMTLLEKYRRTYGRGPRFRRKDLTVELAPGYIIIRKRLGITYLSREDLVPLLRWLVPKIHHLGPSFDPDVAMSEYLEREELFDEAIKKRRRRRGI
jgi:hypothetical protein